MWWSAGSKRETTVGNARLNERVARASEFRTVFVRGHEGVSSSGIEKRSAGSDKAARGHGLASAIAACLVFFGVSALAAPTTASAHLRTGVVAVDYRASVFPPRAPLRRALAARVYKSDQALGLSVRPGHMVLVLGYTGEPFLRINGAGVAVNASSPTAAAAGLLKQSDPVRVRGWHLRSSRSTGDLARCTRPRARARGAAQRLGGSACCRWSPRPAWR